MPFTIPQTVALATTVAVVIAVAVLTSLLFVIRQQKQQRQAAEFSASSAAQLAALETAKAQLAQQLEQQQNALIQRDAELSQTKQNLAAATAQLTAEQKAADEKLQLLEQARETLKTQFENTAQKIFDTKSKQLGERSQEQISQLLNPFAEQLKGFQHSVHLKFETEGKERASLQGEINKLMQLNQQINEEAKALTSALSGKNKVQGNWGEMVLKKVLENSGLREGEEYKEQVSAKNHDGKTVQPDVVVYLPDNRVVVIDSKVSLTAYTAYCSAENDRDRKAHLKAHVQSIKSHVDGLSAKDYHTAFGNQSLDYVFMFLPVEAAYIDAIQAEPGLLEYAMKKNIGIISPSSLLTNLRTVANLWRYEHQNNNALKIAETAGKLYDKLSDALDAFKDVDTRLKQANKSWDTAWSRLAEGRGNVMRTAKQIQALGVKTKKQIEHEHDDKLDHNTDEAQPSFPSQTDRDAE